MSSFFPRVNFVSRFTPTPAAQNTHTPAPQPAFTPAPAPQPVFTPAPAPQHEPTSPTPARYTKIPNFTIFSFSPTGSELTS